VIVFETGSAPRCYTRLLIKLKKAIKECPEEKLRENKKRKDCHQRLKKLLNIKCKEFDREIEEYEKDPVATTEEEDNAN
jgi:hypothetical protein